MKECLYVLRARIKTLISGEAPDTRVDDTRFSKRGGKKKKIRWDRSPSRLLTPSFALSYICEIRFCPRLLFIAVAIDVNLAPIKALAHVRGSVLAGPADKCANLHRPYCCALKSQSKFHVDPLCDWPTVLRVRDSMMRPDNRSRTWWRSDVYYPSQEAIIASMHWHVI